MVNEWAQIAADHEEWNENEVMMLVSGFQNLLNTKRLTNCNAMVSIQMIILSLYKQKRAKEVNIYFMALIDNTL